MTDDPNQPHIDANLKLSILQEETLSVLTLIRDEIEGLFDRRANTPSEADSTLRNLFFYMGERGQSVNFLLSWGYSWDAEIILRSYYEVSVRIALLCFSDEIERKELLQEFWTDLGAIGDRRRAIKAGLAGKVMKLKNGNDDPIFSALEDPRIFRTLPKGNKAERKRLEQKWSFTQIIDTLSKKRISGKNLELISGLLHYYGMASHLLHADQMALDLMYDRATRDPSEALILARAHAARIMNDLASLSLFCADALRIMFELEFENEALLYATFDKMSTISGEILTEFRHSQEQFYADIANSGK